MKQTITIPACQQHEGYRGNLLTIEVDWNCLICGAERGEVFETLSYDGSRRLAVSGWQNPCGHVETYTEVRHAHAAQE